MPKWSATSFIIMPEVLEESVICYNMVDKGSR